MKPWCASVQFSSVTQPCPTLCDLMNRSTPGLPVHHQFPEFTQTHIRRVHNWILFLLWLHPFILSGVISPLEGLILKLKLQYFGFLMWRANSLEKILMLGKTEGWKRGWQKMRWLDGISDSMDMNLSKLRDMVRDRKVWDTAGHGVTKSWTRLSE